MISILTCIILGLLHSGDLIEQHLAQSSAVGSPKAKRHFSTFPLTSHLHTATVRLVALHPLLSVSLACLRVPEIHDDFIWKVYVARTTTVQEVINQVVEELGLTKALPVPGGGNLDYVIEEAWASSDDESTALIPRLIYVSHNVSQNPLGFLAIAMCQESTKSHSHQIPFAHRRLGDSPSVSPMNGIGVPSSASYPPYLRSPLRKRSDGSQVCMIRMTTKTRMTTKREFERSRKCSNRHQARLLLSRPSTLALIGVVRLRNDDSPLCSTAGRHLLRRPFPLPLTVEVSVSLS